MGKPDRVYFPRMRVYINFQITTESNELLYELQVPFLVAEKSIDYHFLRFNTVKILISNTKNIKILIATDGDVDDDKLFLWYG